MNDLFSARVTVPQGVLVRELDGESVLLKLDTGVYYGLDEVGTRMWSACTTAPSIGHAFDSLADEYDVEPELLRADMDTWLHELAEQGLLEILGV